MPSTKTIEIPSVSAITKLLHYLEDEEHRNHAPKGYQIEKMRSAHPDLTRQNFVTTAKQIVEQLNAGKRGGAPVKNLATLHILRVPYSTYLTPRERRYYALRYIRDILPDGLAVFNWHLNPLHGSDDLNVMALNSTSLEAPRTRRKSNVDPVAQARRVADRITDRLNQNRLALGKNPPIVTMQEVQQEIARERRGQTLEQQLAALPTRVTLENLREQIEALGHTINRFSPKKNYFTVRFKTSKPLEEIADEKKRKRAARGNRFNLVETLAKVWQIRDQNRAATLTEEKTKSAAHYPSDDDEINRIIDEEIKKHPRPPEPPMEPPASPELGL